MNRNTANAIMQVLGHYSTGDSTIAKGETAQMADENIQRYAVKVW